MDSLQNGSRAQARLVLYREEIDELERLAYASVLDEWQLGHTATQTVDDAVAYMADCLRKRDDPDLWLVFVGDVAAEGGTLLPATTGNGPHSRAHAEYLVGAQPRTILKLCAFLRHMLDGQHAIDIPFDSSKIKPAEE